jgi:hypothetical protein
MRITDIITEAANPAQQAAIAIAKKKKKRVSEGSDSQLDINQLAAISDAALDAAYGYGRSSPGNTFGWQANLKSAAYAKQMIDRGVTDVETISDAIHKGWNVTARAFVQDPDQFDDTEKLKAAGKLEAKLQQREKLMNIGYVQLSDEEQEKDRVVARALLQALTGQQGVAEGDSGAKYKVKSIGRDAKGDYYISPSTGKKVYKKGVKVGDHENPKTGEHKGVEEGYTNDDIETTRQFRNTIAGLKAKNAIDKAKDGAGAKYYSDGAKVTPQETARRAAERKAQKDKKGVAEDTQQVDSLVTDALKIMRGSEVNDAVAALKTVLGDREYNGRRGFYNFYIRQLMDMYSQQGVMEDWQKANKRDKTDGMSQKAVNAYRRENPGSKLKTAVTTKPGKLKKGSKAANRRKSFCARMGGNKGPMKKPNGKPTPKALALRRWNCESIEELQELVMLAEQFVQKNRK